MTDQALLQGYLNWAAAGAAAGVLGFALGIAAMALSLNRGAELRRLRKLAELNERQFVQCAGWVKELGENCQRAFDAVERRLPPAKQPPTVVHKVDKHKGES